MTCARAADLTLSISAARRSTPRVAVFQRALRAGARFVLESWNPVVTVDTVIACTGFAFEADSAKPTSPITARKLDALDARREFAAQIDA